MDAAVARECVAVRTTAGVLDASTLGKIEVVGPDAAAFLDRMYTNRMSTLAVGSIRYGFLLGLDGMVADDGVAMRVGGGPLLRHDDHRERRDGPRPVRGVAPDGVAGAPRLLHERHGAVGRCRDRGTEGARRPRRARDRHRPLHRRVPVHDVPGRHRRGDPRSGRPRELHGRALLRGPRRRPAGARALGGRDRRRRAVRDRAVRHGGDARPPRREGLRDRRAGHRRDRDARRSRDGMDRAEGRLGLHRQAVAPASGHGRVTAGSSSSGSSPTR